MTTQTKRVCPADGVEAALHLLHNWFKGCDGLAELRYRTKRGMAQEWFTLNCLGNMAKRAIVLSNKNCEVYFGVATRTERKGCKDSVAMIPGPFCDLDFSAFEAGGIEAMERLDRFRPQPTALVHSGGGLHCYWKLQAALMPTPDIRTKIRALVHELGADQGATDLSRVLRVPGTWSWKRNLPVRLLRCRCQTSN